MHELKTRVATAAANPEFRHHKWFVHWHLEIVDKIALELCDLHPEANREIVQILVWLHDYPKILDFANRDKPEVIDRARGLLQELQYPTELINEVMTDLNLIESKMTVDLSTAVIEVKILSSADAASHLVGPFFPFFWYENTNLPIDKILEQGLYKLWKDWERKMVLPEVKAAFKARYELMSEVHGKLPEKMFPAG